MRIAIVSSPRVGNTWVRSVLGSTLRLEQFAVHDPDDLPASLPDDCILQLHWYREPRFQALLRRERFRVVTIARHPLDLLLSILHFCRREPQTTRWLGGNGELPDALRSASPASPVFREWASGRGAENLLSISYQWWQDPGAVRVRYEDLVRDPSAFFGALIEELGGQPQQLDGSIATFDLAHFQSTANRHGWQGRPDLWRQLIPTFDAHRIRARHRRAFEILGYRVAPHLLTRAASEVNWNRLRA